MRILVDEIPRDAMNCLFAEYKSEKDVVICRLDNWGVDNDCPKRCNYLAKGVVACELAVKADGEAEAGKAV